MGKLFAQNKVLVNIYQSIVLNMLYLNGGGYEMQTQRICSKIFAFVILALNRVLKVWEFDKAVSVQNKSLLTFICQLSPNHVVSKWWL
jgi:hypothetical protein